MSYSLQDERGENQEILFSFVRVPFDKSSRPRSREVIESHGAPYESKAIYCKARLWVGFGY